MTSLTDTQVITASGGLVELGYGQATSNTTISNATAGTGTEVIAPVTVVCDGSPIIVEFFSPEVRPHNTANDEINISLFEDSSEKIRSWGRNYNAAGGYNNKPTYLSVRLTPSAGSHTYGVKAYVSNAARTGSVGGGTGTSTTSAPCFLRVSKIVEATQWPAVTTGTIICTSSTRPASPFEGQKIYETDTNREYLWNGSSWLPAGTFGTWDSWNPTLTQNGSLSVAVFYGRYTQVGTIVHAAVTLFVTGGTGTAGYGVRMSLPVTAAANAPLRIGSGHIYDASTGIRYTGMCELDSTTHFRFVGNWSGGLQWGWNPSISTTTNDQYGASITYEAA